MIDIHNHLIFGIDDGARDLDETVEMCSIAEKDGITEIIATPHYDIGVWNNEGIENKLNLITNELDKRGINVKIYRGNEIYLSLNSFQQLLDGLCFSLNNSRYVLVEFSMMDIPNFVFDALYNLRIKGYIPIIAHPERNSRIIEDPQLVYDFILEGCLIQINGTCLTGNCGKECQKLSELLIKHNMVHFIASDAHSSRYRTPVLSHALSHVQRIAGTAAGERLLYTNPGAVIKNEEIRIDEPISFNKKRSKSIFKRRC